MLINSAKYEDSHKLTALLAQDTLIVTIIVFTMGHVLRIRFFPPPNLDPCHLNMDYRHLLSPSHRNPNPFWSCIWIFYSNDVPITISQSLFVYYMFVCNFLTRFLSFSLILSTTTPPKYFLKNKSRIRRLGVLIKKLEILLWFKRI